MKCNEFFKPGKMTVVMDGGAGSSGKGKLGAYIIENSNNCDFVCNTFAPQAGHWVKLDDGRSYFYQSLNSCAYNLNKYKKMYIGAGATIELPALLKEIEDNKIPAEKLGIHPLCPILEEFDKEFEQGKKDFDNKESEFHPGTSKFGSTAHGVGSVSARRVLRRQSLRTAKDINELKQYICNVEDEIIERLENGQSGMLEIAQGFQLSLMHKSFFPYVTYRNCSVAQGFSDMFLPIKYAGDVILNFRTYPIRINSNKYISKIDKRHLTWKEVEDGEPYDLLEGNSGPGYDDQIELSWSNISKNSNSPRDLTELTSVTKLPRRVFSFSKKNLIEAIKYNDTGNKTHLSLNFANYVDWGLYGKDDIKDLYNSDIFMDWVKRNIPSQFYESIKFVGTSERDSGMIFCEKLEIL